MCITQQNGDHMSLARVIILFVFIISCTPEELDQLTELQSNQENIEGECSTNTENDLEAFNNSLKINQPSDDMPKPQACQELAQSDTSSLEVNILMRDFNSEQEVKMLRVIEKIKIAINSQEFKKRVLNYSYKKDEFSYYFRRSETRFSNEAIYQKITTGAEILLPEEDSEIDIDVTMYFENSSTVGFTRKSTIRTYVNSKFFNPYSDAQVSRNVVHEWMHKLGFTHSSNRTSLRRHSVPYAIGYIIEDLIEKL